MAVHISNNRNRIRIRATGIDANSFFIAMSDDKTLLRWEEEKTGDEEFQRMVKEAIAARCIETKQGGTN